MDKQVFISMRNSVSTQGTLLVVEDSEEDYEMLLRVIQKKSLKCDLFRCETGREALDFLWNQGNYQDKNQYKKPVAILLDLNLPGIDGRVVLEKIKTHQILRLIPVIVFTTSSNPKDIHVCYEKGANAYIVKPMDVVKLQKWIEVLLTHWLEMNTINLAQILSDN